MDKENIIDFGQWSVPTDWSQVTLKKFSDIERYYSDKDKKFDVREVLHILTDKTIDEVNALPVEFTEKIMEELMFLTETPDFGESSRKITIDGVDYMINPMEKLKTGEYVSFDTILKADQYDYSSMLAVLCRKEGEIYDSKYEAEEFEKRKEMFSKQPVMKVMPLVAFFLELYMIRNLPSLLYSEVEEELNLIQQSIESLQGIGASRRWFLNLRVRKLRRLLKSSRNT